MTQMVIWKVKIKSIMYLDGRSLQDELMTRDEGFIIHSLVGAKRWM